MTLAEFAIVMVGTLAWPATIIAVLLMFRRDIDKLLRRGRR